jgi:hypothetical protein
MRFGHEPQRCQSAAESVGDDPVSEHGIVAREDLFPLPCREIVQQIDAAPTFS